VRGNNPLTGGRGMPPKIKVFTVNIMLNSQHKRVFILDKMYKQEQAEELLKELIKATNFWSFQELFRVDDTRFTMVSNEEGDLCLLGQGAFGKVYKAVDNFNDNRLVAIKSISKMAMTVEDYI
jgi:hypothetical protein